jgi:predicted DNA-binding protein YlxM (UPF0122 family)
MSNKKQIIKYSELLIHYIKLFTPKQRSYLTDYFLNDLSLKEIANKHKVSVMAISDSINRSKKMLNYYEKNLMLYDKSCKRRKVYNKINQLSIKHQLIDIDKP